MTDLDNTDKSPTRMTLNGAAVAVGADPDTPLLYVLRNDLGMNSVRFGCGVGQCGACTVIVNGRPMHSCDMPLWSAADATVETVEGLGTPDAGHPLLAAFIEAQAGQCGYCLAGILMRAKALLDENARPSRADIAAALDDNLCRCGTHVRILKAIAAAGERVAAEGAR